ncbi:MAG: Dyp-type peroxidase [Propionicimonas sp.]|nr:Dyp-type peroxidase [Propionicimonas sp.]
MLGRPENLPHRATEPPRFDLSDIQGNVLRGYTLPACAYVFVRILDIAKACRLLERTLPMVMTAEPWTTPPLRAMNVAVSYSALQKLGLDPTVLASFPDVFREGMRARAQRLGDRGPSAPENWEIPDFDFMVTVYAQDLANLQVALDEVIATDVEAGVDPVFIQLALDRPTAQDHFGNFDGVSQPALTGSGVIGRPGDGQPDGDGGWRDVAVGEVLLGYEDEDGTLPAAPAEPFDRNGTFVVVRKLATDVAAYRRFLASTNYPGGPDLLAAKLLGRWPDGTPLALSPERPDPATVADPGQVNNFTYESDPLGLACPVGSHIRRANPRDSKGFFEGRLTNRHRIVRRGRAYGAPLDPGATQDDGVDRGLMFVCFQADIWRQFETIQALWVDDGNPFGLGRDKDPLIGEHHDSLGKLTIPGHPPFFVKPVPRFVTMRGGGYLFQPSISALRYMASLA